MRRLVALALFMAACSAAESTPVSTTELTPSPPAQTTTTATTSLPISTTAPTTTSPAAPPTTATPLEVAEPGTVESARIQIRIRFESRVDSVTGAQLATQALAILNDPGGWIQSGFTFVDDDSSELTVILAEGEVVDALCLPLETYGTVSCQNGAVVALNADRWRLGGDDWDGTVESYRTYLVNHEVGHLIGLRHPVERCPTGTKLSALMEPQTNNLLDCVGNGIPLEWEIEWAKRRPAVIGPDPAWDGPRPSWPSDG